MTDEASKAAFEDFLRQLEERGVEVVEPEADDDLLAYEDATTRTPEWFFDLMLWEIRTPMRTLRERRPEALSETMSGHVAKAEALSLDDYRRSMAAQARLRSMHRGLKGQGGWLCHPCAHRAGSDGQPTLGTPWYNDASSAVGAPVFSLPLLKAEDVPLGIQIMGFEGEDERLTAIARWCLDAFGPLAARFG